MVPMNQRTGKHIESDENAVNYSEMVDDIDENNTDDKTSCKSGTCKGFFDEVPSWEVDNNYIQTGYRLRYHTFREVGLTLFKCHNETFNICSHLCGSLVGLFVIVYIMCKYPNMLSEA